MRENKEAYVSMIWNQIIKEAVMWIIGKGGIFYVTALSRFKMLLHTKHTKDILRLLDRASFW